MPLVSKNGVTSRLGDKSMVYSIRGGGLVLTPQADDLDPYINTWVKKHSRAVATVVDQSIMGPKLGWLDYIWVADGANNLNIDLVRTGKPDFPERLVDDEVYAAFMKKVVAAEIAARAAKVGLWSDEDRQMMEEEGFLPQVQK